MSDPMPRHVKPMLAKLVAEPFDRAGWYFEVKWDGYRAIAEIQNGRVHLYSRNDQPFDERYPTVGKALQKIKHNVVLDGEIVALKNGKPDFHTLQNYGEAPAPLQYVLFDILYCDGKDLRSLPLSERKKVLEKVVPKKDKILLLSRHAEGTGKKFFELMRKQGLEGMVAKDASSTYHTGVRTDAWQKIKTHMEQEAIIVGFTEPRGSRKNLGALVLAAHVDGKLTYIGHSGGGFTQRELRDLCEELRKIKVTKSPLKEKVPVNAPVTWVRPKYVCEIKFTEWTPESHMRHPIYVGMRIDKKPSEVVREIPETKADQTRRNVHRRGGAGVRKSTAADFRVPTGLDLPKGLVLSHLDKIFWPKEKYTKGDVLAYYNKMADTILPYLKDRPENLNRHPNGITGENFYQKNITTTLPGFVATTNIWSDSNTANLRYIVCQNKETLLYLANLGCIELNPWNSRTKSLEYPDYLIIDLDPDGNSYNQVVEVAQAVHKVLTMTRVPHYAKTSGKTGMHICVPLGARYTYEEIKKFAQLVAQIVHSRVPQFTSIERMPAKRRKKIYIDFLQNRFGQTIAAPYSLRPYPGATVSTPLLWSEVRKGLDPKKFTITTIEKRLKQKGDLWRPLLTEQADLREGLRLVAHALEGGAPPATRAKQKR